LQSDIAARLFREAIQVFKGAVNNQFSRRRRTGQVLNGIVDLENEGVYEAANIAESMFSNIGLSRYQGRAARERYQEARDGGYFSTVAREKPRNPVCAGALAGGHWNPVQVSANVFGELGDRCVALLRFFRRALRRMQSRSPRSVRASFGRPRSMLSRTCCVLLAGALKTELGRLGTALHTVSMTC